MSSIVPGFGVLVRVPITTDFHSLQKTPTFLSGLEPKIVAIINPISCPLGVDDMKRQIADALIRYSVSCQFLETCETETTLPLAQKAVAEGANLIIAAGGDGTIMEAINAALGTSIPIGIVPAGTGNLLAVNLNIPIGNIPEAIDIAMNGRTIALDLIRVLPGGKYFAIMAGLGWDATIMHETSREIKKRIGKLGYILTALRGMRGHTFHVEINLDSGKRFRTRAKSVLIANVGQVAKGVNLFPNADPTDGLMEIGILKAASPFAFFHLIIDTLCGRPHQNPYFNLYQTSAVTIRSRRKMPFEMDGEYIGELNALSAEVIPAAANVRVPAR